MGVFTKGDNDDNEYGIIVEVDEEGHHKRVGRSNMKVSKGVRNAALLDTFLGGLTNKTARIMCKEHKNVGFTYKEYVEMRNRYGNVLGELTQIVRSKAPPGFPNRYTSIPGQIIHVDPKQCGGSKGAAQESVLHGVCQVTGFQVAVEMTGDDDKAWIDATRRLVKRFRIY